MSQIIPQEIVDKIDDTLKFEQDLKSTRSPYTYKVERGGLLYVLKLVDISFSYWGIEHIKRERETLERAKTIGGITHLVEYYEVGSYIAVLKEYAEGDTWNYVWREAVDSCLPKQLKRTLKNLHEIGIAGLEIHSGDVVVTSDKTDAKIIDFGKCRLRNECSWTQFQLLKLDDRRELRSLFRIEETNEL